MKRITSIVLAIIFIFSTMGVTFATHYCGGKLFGTRLVMDIHHDPCGCPPMLDKDNCCKDEITQLKIQDNFVGSAVSSISSEQFLFTSIISKFQFPICNLQFTISNYLKPPLIHLSIPIFTQSLRFWLILFSFLQSRTFGIVSVFYFQKKLKSWNQLKYFLKLFFFWWLPCKAIRKS